MKSIVSETEIERTVIVKTVEKTITLELDELEAWVLYKISCLIGGDPDKSLRGIFSTSDNSLGEQLKNGLSQYYNVTREQIRVAVGYSSNIDFRLVKDQFHFHNINKDALLRDIKDVLKVE